MRCEIWAQPARALCLEYRVLWVRVPPEAVFFTALGVLCCFALFDLASFFLPSHLSFKNMYMYMEIHVHSTLA